MTRARHRTPRTPVPSARWGLGLALACLLTQATPPQAAAGWLASGGGGAEAAAAALPPGPQPTAVSWLGITVSWPATTLPDGTAVTGYVVERYVENATSPSPMPADSGCLGTTRNGVPNVVTGTSCGDTRGWLDSRYTYTVRPVLQSWVGPRSPRSSPPV